MAKTPFSRHKKSLNSDMNVVPYIDVMLVLLVIFMVTAPMLTTGVEVNLPKEKTTTISHDKKLPVIITLKTDGSLLMSYDSTMDEPVDKTALQERIGSMVADSTAGDGTSNLSVMINADADNQYRDIMRLMASLQKLGVSKVGLLTDSAAPKK